MKNYKYRIMRDLNNISLSATEDELYERFNKFRFALDCAQAWGFITQEEFKELMEYATDQKFIAYTILKEDTEEC